MLLSMTGHGGGRKQVGSAEITVEVRAVNNRHLKIQMRTCDGLGRLEPEIEKLVRKRLRRGSLQVAVQVSGGPLSSEYSLQESVIKNYVQQCREIAAKLNLMSEVTVSDVLALPGVILDPKNRPPTVVNDEFASQVLETVDEALHSLNDMRRAEGSSMADELSSQIQELTTYTTEIESRAPLVVQEYRERLMQKITKALEDFETNLQESDLVREVLLLADKVDIREELVRLESHFSQFEKLIGAEESQGRKLDFLIQEMFREVNTIGSKASDSLISQRVVDIKTQIEQMRELVQNVE